MFPLGWREKETLGIPHSWTCRKPVTFLLEGTEPASHPVRLLGRQQLANTQVQFLGPKYSTCTCCFCACYCLAVTCWASCLPLMRGRGIEDLVITLP